MSAIVTQVPARFYAAQAQAKPVDLAQLWRLLL
jgi:hypothetical protein